MPTVTPTPSKPLLLLVDKPLMGAYVALVLLGWLSIYAVGYHEAIGAGAWLGVSSRAVKQSTWLGITLLSWGLLQLINTRVYHLLAYALYVGACALLVGVFVVGKKVGGHAAWFKLGGAHLQPAEPAKLAVALALARFLGSSPPRLTRWTTLVPILLLLGVPMGLVALQGDLGSSLVFVAFILVLYREGLPESWLLRLLGIGLTAVLTVWVPAPYLLTAISMLGLLRLGRGALTWRRSLKVGGQTVLLLAWSCSVHFVVHHVLKPHHRHRLEALFNPEADPRGIGWNVNQSKIAIGAGGLTGRGLLQGTQTRFGFVPEQETDFIFCTLSEAYGWLGATLVIGLFALLLLRVLVLAERQHHRFGRAYGYAVFALLMAHFSINVGMTIGLMPVIGIPLPLLSYGGSALWTFSMLLFILLKMDVERSNYRQNIAGARIA